MQVKVQDYTSRMCTAVVGDKDYTRALRILEHSKFPNLELLLAKWKRSNSAEFKTKIEEHDKLVSRCRAFKLNRMDAQCIEDMRQEVVKNPAINNTIIDISTTGHTWQSGTAYVQYDSNHKSTVLEWLRPYLVGLQKDRCHLGAKFPGGPSLVSTDTSIAMTKQTDAAPNDDGPIPETLPPSQFHQSSLCHGQPTQLEALEASPASCYSMIDQPKASQLQRCGKGRLPITWP